MQWEEARQASALGHCQVVLIDGPVGGGKTELLHTVTERVARQDAVVLTALGSAAGALVPCGVLSQLFRPVQAPPDSTETVSRMFDIVTSGWPRGATDEPVPLQVLFELSAHLLELTTRHPVIMLVDDVQHADPPSLHTLLFLMRRLRSARLLIALAEPEHGLRHNAIFRTELLRHPGFRRIRLEPLSPESVGLIMAEHLGTEPQDLREYHAMSGGNPLLTRALADDLSVAAGGGDPVCGEEAVAGGSFTQAVLACLHRGTASMLAVARTLAVFDDPCSPETLGQFLDLPPTITAQALNDLSSAGLIIGERLRHHTIRDAVLSDLTATERADLHRRAARLAHRLGDPVTRIAEHLVAAGHCDESWAVATLRAAAQTAIHDDQTKTTIKILELTLRADLTGKERLAVTMQLLRADWRLNPAASARHLAPLVQAFEDGLLQLHQTITLVKFLLWHGRLQETADILDALKPDDVTTPEAQAELALLECWLATTYPSLVGRLPLPAQNAPAVTGRLRTRIRAAELLAEVLSGRTGADLAHDAKQFLHQVPLEDSSLELIEAGLSTLTYLDRAGTAAALCDPLLKEAAKRAIPTWTALLSAKRAQIALRQGDPAGAARHARAALSFVSAEGWGMTAAAPLASLVLALTILGRQDEAGALLLNRPMTEIAQNSRFGLHYLHARGRHHLAVHRHHAALADFLNCGELMTRWDLDLPALIPWRSEAATVLLRLGDREQAARLAGEQLAKAGPEWSRCRGVSLRVLANASSVERRPPLLQEAITILGEHDDPLELAHACADLATAYQSLDDLDRSRQLLDRAVRLADECQARPLRDALKNQRSTQSEPFTEPCPTLSGAELRVATLAAEGRTNREISLALFITVSTVEQHLTRVYRKLKVRTRADLRRHLSTTSSC
ncbi:helix-turn-helix transcriptional regulator [Actinomadura rubrisoli]|uniref:Helix-turn-helix transcriptional regulator n=2 Tax=Actinomadura rubrisoli TaxID=2530368 RepID=A0A4R5B146_9ACTN|nr:helix-turn-helix transcriptional regulator [Actinomadura rubrisoli]